MPVQCPEAVNLRLGKMFQEGLGTEVAVTVGLQDLSSFAIIESDLWSLLKPSSREETGGNRCVR